MGLEGFQIELEKHLVKLDFVQQWKRIRKNTTVKIVVQLKNDKSLHVFYNVVLNIQSFALVANGKRIWGLDKDNRLGWHEHPLKNSEQHKPIVPQTIEQIVEHFKAIWHEL